MAQLKTLHVGSEFAEIADRVSEARLSQIFREHPELPKMRRNSYLQNRTSGPMTEIGGPSIFGE